MRFSLFKKYLVVVLILLGLGIVVLPQKAFAQTAAVNLGTTDSFAVLAGSTVVDTSVSNVTGNVGLSPASGSFIGIPCAEVTGTIYSVDASGPLPCRITNADLLTTAKNDLTIAYLDAAGRTPTSTLVAGDNQLGGQVLTDGVYAFGAASTANLIGTLTLDAQGNPDAVFIFQASSSFITASGSVVALVNGAQACNVFWQVTSSATLGTGSTFIGTAMALASITDDSGSSINGRLLASTAAVTLNDTTITTPSCATATTPTSSAGSSSGESGSGSSSDSICIASAITTTPIIIESRRVSPTSVFISWGPFAGLGNFNVRYGLENGNWLYNTDFAGFSMTINDLPPNQPIWVQVAARNDCAIGNYGEPRLVGGPRLAEAGLVPPTNNFLWYMVGGSPLLSVSLLFLKSRRH